MTDVVKSVVNSGLELTTPLTTVFASQPYKILRREVRSECGAYLKGSRAAAENKAVRHDSYTRNGNKRQVVSWGFADSPASSDIVITKNIQGRIEQERVTREISAVPHPYYVWGTSSGCKILLVSW